MTHARRALSDSGFYHVVARGVGRSIIFEDDYDRSRFLVLLERHIIRGHVTVLAWCLMDNHYHLVLEGAMQDISLAMRKLNSSYATVFNERHDRSGHLFQGRFRSEAIEDENYLLTVIRYVHQNPVRAGITSTCDYDWSSYRGYFDRPRLVKNARMLELLGSGEAFASLHDELDQRAACIDVDSPSGRTPLSSERALLAARTVLGATRVEEVYGLDRAARDEALRRLKEAHLSLRQIERLTGVSRSVVAKA